MKTFKLKYLYTLILLSASFIMGAYAVNPTISVYQNSSNIKTLSVYGDANQQVTLYYHTKSNPGVYNYLGIGMTNNLGRLDYDFDTLRYNIVNNDNVYVIVNNQQSSVVNLNNYNYDTNAPIIYPTLSQNSLSLTPGQSRVVNIYNMYNNIYISNNTNSAVAATSVTGNTLTVTALTPGFNTITISGNNNVGQLSTLSLTVYVSGTATNYPPLINTNVNNPRPVYVYDPYYYNSYHRDDDNYEYKYKKSYKKANKKANRGQGYKHKNYHAKEWR